ncbi:hypothetical protein MF271_24515 (plasmid) [Deinococcus sp. KNUC1210]|uniref:hypothetical protein n=1 Tax=Deinococcus sp. KNUC1210 TaxID=2917691 RepID=UPI001EF0E2B0|nr:hypothetical protein [Deinococcus sp. KNUC1210]ULH18120.1 hypothetical protein MF271_24515 [Deinococcus sp. KNUC1210]
MVQLQAAAVEAAIRGVDLDGLLAHRMAAKWARLQADPFADSGSGRGPLAFLRTSG